MVNKGKCDIYEDSNCMHASLVQDWNKELFFFQFAVFLGHKSDQKTRDCEAAQLISYLIYRY